MAAATAYLTLDLELISANGLGHVYGLFSSKMECYAEATMSGYPGSGQKTPTDRVGHCNPTWNYTLRFNIPEPDVVLEVVIWCENGYGHDKEVGKVSIPVKDLFDAACKRSSPSALTYPVMRESREPMGWLRFSYKLNNPLSAPPLQQVGQQYGSPSPPVAVYRPTRQVAQHNPSPQVPEQYSIPSPPVVVYPPPEVPQQYTIPSPTSLVPQENGSEAYYPHHPSPLYGMPSAVPVTVYHPRPSPQPNPSPPVLQHQYGAPSPASSAYPPRPVVAYMESQSIQPLAAYMQQPPPPAAVAASNGYLPTVAYQIASPPVVRPPPGPRPAIQYNATQHPPRNGILATAIGGVLAVNALASLPENLSSASHHLFGNGGLFDFGDLF